VDQDTTKQMQDALQAAIARINPGSGEPKSGLLNADTIGVVMSIVQKLLQGSESSEELVEKLDTMRTDDLASLREQVQILRKQCIRVMKSQEQLLAKVDDIRKEQATMGRAVLDLAHHMARITFIDEGPAGDSYAEDDSNEEFDEGPLVAPERYNRAEFGVNGNGRRRQRNT
jgi:hypothetical protein